MLRPVILLSLLFIAATGLLGASCLGGSDPKSSSIPTTPGPATLARIPLGYGSGNLLVEVAITPSEIEKGLGGRDALFDRGGMLFDIGSTRVPSFWMKDMRIPLDFVWITEDKKIAAITPDVQPQPDVPDEQLQRYSSDVPVRYVLEINAGAAANFGLAPGQQLTFTIPPNLIATPTPIGPASGLPPSPVIGATP
jgi:uncharacterized membrane protein (UPF0127 family)